MENLSSLNGARGLLTGPELCQVLKVRQAFLYAPARRKGPDAVPCVKVGKYLRYDLDQVRAWIAKQNEGARI